MESREERYVFVAEQGSVDEFGHAVDREVRKSRDMGFCRTLHISHSLAVVGGVAHWSAMLVLGVEPDDEGAHPAAE